jgi:hypothetical protein
MMQRELFFSSGNRPPCFRLGCFASDRLAFLWRELFRSFLSANPPEFCRPLPCGVWGPLLNLPCRNPHDADRIADHVGGALFSFGASGHRISLN